MADEGRMDAGQLIEFIRFIELRSKRKRTALRDMVEAAHLDEEGIQTEYVLQAIEEREAVAQTIVAPGFAMPHALLSEWPGRCRIVIGRSRDGIDYGAASGERVHLVVLLLIGREGESQYMAILRSLADLFVTEEFRRDLIESDDIRGLERRLREELGLIGPGGRLADVPRISVRFAEQAVQLADALSADAVMVVVDRSVYVPWEILRGLPRKLIVVTKERDETHREESTTTLSTVHMLDLPQQELSVSDRAKLGLLMAGMEGLLGADGTQIVTIIASDGRTLDSIQWMRAQSPLRWLLRANIHRKLIRSGVLLRVLTIAHELAVEGREGRPVGTLFVIGDTNTVRKYAQQMVLNPFKGFSRKLRNILDPSITETIKEFAQIDGGFIVRADGTVESAGTYLSVGARSNLQVPAGLGARHRSAAAITSVTRALAVVVSSSTRRITVFGKGRVVFSLEPTKGADRVGL